MKKITFATGLALTVAIALCRVPTIAVAQTPASQPPPTADAAPAPGGLSDLEATTFSCPKAALNAAAREAAKHPSQGTYQFSYFNIVSDTHHAAYEVRFRSNYAAEPELKYCVMLYCQQGFDPTTTKTTVMLIGTPAAAHGTGAGHAANDCRPPRPARKK